MAYHIAIQEQDQVGPLLEYGPVGFIEHENRVQGLDAPSLALIKRLEFATKILEGEDLAVDDFVAELLRVMGYERDETLVRTRKASGYACAVKSCSRRQTSVLWNISSEVLLLV